MNTRVQRSGEDDLQALGKIHEARPKGRDVVAAAKKIPGARVVEHDDGRFEVSATEHRAKRALAHIFDEPRRLETERSDRVKERRELVMVRNRHGRLVEINADSESGAGSAGLLTSSRRTFFGGLPECGGNIMDAEHEYVDGRCRFCGRKEKP